MKKNKLAQPAQQTQQKTEPKPKKRFSYYKLVIYSFLLVILILPVVVILSQTYLPTDGIQRPLSGTQSSPRDYPFVNPAEECYVHNKTTAVTYMVPFRTAMEWTAFKSFATKNASIISVTCPECTPKTCADKTGLAAINNGFNCGSLLNDGCGGTLNCMDNCAAGEVCSNGAIGSACDLGDLSQCGGYKFKGHCEVDNGCIPIIDFAEIDANRHGRRGCVVIGPFVQAAEACNQPSMSGPYSPAIFFKGNGCYAGPSNGVGLTSCDSYFFHDPYDAKFYTMSDGTHYPYASYLNLYSTNIDDCASAGGYTPPQCFDPEGYNFCMSQSPHPNTCYEQYCGVEPIE